MRLREGLFVFLSLAVIGCSQKVLVTDKAGKPVQGAAVSPAGFSMNGNATLTDANGVATVPGHVGGEDTKWVDIQKPGFDRVQVNVPAQWPLRVTLGPAGKANLGIQVTTQP